MRHQVIYLLIVLALFAFISCEPVYVVSERPPEVVYVRPAPPPGEYVWKGGNWVWENGKYIWREGHWERKREGHYWVDGHWKSVPKGYQWIPGHWN